MNGVPAFLFGVYSGQINFQVPWELAGHSEAILTISAGGATSGPAPVTLEPYAPGIFSTSSSGSGQGAILISNTAFIASPVGAFPGSRPASRGDFGITGYLTNGGRIEVAQRMAGHSNAKTTGLSELHCYAERIVASHLLQIGPGAWKR